MTDGKKYNYSIATISSGGCQVLTGNITFEFRGWDTAWYYDEKICILTRQDETGEIIHAVQLCLNADVFERHPVVTVKNDVGSFRQPENSNVYKFSLTGYEDDGNKVKVMDGQPRNVSQMPKEYNYSTMLLDRGGVAVKIDNGIPINYYGWNHLYKVDERTIWLILKGPDGQIVRADAYTFDFNNDSASGGRGEITNTDGTKTIIEENTKSVTYTAPFTNKPFPPVAVHSGKPPIQPMIIYVDEPENKKEKEQKEFAAMLRKLVNS